MEKKRDLRPVVNAAIIALTNMLPEVCTLEFHDNDKASRALKNKVVEFKAKELRNLEDSIKAIREQINTVKIKTKKQKNEPEQTVH